MSPTMYAVAATVVVDGAELDDQTNSHVEEVVVDDQVGMPAMFAITMQDPRRNILDLSGLRVGAAVEISIAGQGSSSDDPLVKGEVVAVECDYDEIGSRVVIRGYSPAHRLHRGRHTRTFVNVTDSDIVTKVAGDAGLDLGIVQETSEVHEHVAQANVSDWEFLSARARAIGYELAVADGKLEFGKPTQAAGAPGPEGADADGDSRDPRLLIYGDNLYAFHGRLSAAEQVSEVMVRGWDDTRKEAVSATAPAATVAATLDLADPASLAGFFGETTFIAVDQAIGTEREADAAAKALAERIGSAFAQADGMAAGNTALRAGVAVRIMGVSDDFSGSYVLSQTRHVIDSHGYRTHFTIAGRDRTAYNLGATSGASGQGGADGATGFTGLVRGTVSENADPDNLGRVKVSLGWLDDGFSSTWAPVMQIGAGPASGSFFLPAVGDEVLVGFEQGQVGRPVVIGGLFNGIDQPPTYSQWLDNGAVTGRGIYSRKGHFLEFWDDDGHNMAVLSTAGAEASLAVDAANRKVVIQSDGAVEITAQGELKVHASKITLEADGQLVLKGAQITLN
jgi:phage protein D/phage baseplate assembly protein gpV